MIFDSPAMQKLREKYADELDHRVPEIVLVDRSPKLTGERVVLEQAICQASPTKQQDWLQRLVSEDHSQHVGAWFEMRLLGWLQQLGEVCIEPRIHENHPDFLVHTATQQIAVEARAVVKTDTERLVRQRDEDTRIILSRIQRPYRVTIKKLKHGESIDEDRLTSDVLLWIDRGAQGRYTYQDDRGNLVALEAQLVEELDGLSVVGPMRSEWIDHEPLKAPIREKAKQHRNLRTSGHPYVIALYLESPRYSPEEIVAAWFGKTTYTIDTETNQVVAEGLDYSGVHFWRQRISQKTVSGTLVCKSRLDPSEGKHHLKVWYIQNPYANAPVEDEELPVIGRFVVIERTNTSFTMNWRPTSVETSDSAER